MWHEGTFRLKLAHTLKCFTLLQPTSPEVRSRWAVSMGLSFLIVVSRCFSSRFKHSKHHSLKVYRATNSETCKICGSLRSCFQCVFKYKQKPTIFLMRRSLGIFALLIVVFVIFIYTYIIVTGFPYSSSACNEMWFVLFCIIPEQDWDIWLTK